MEFVKEIFEYEKGDCDIYEIKNKSNNIQFCKDYHLISKNNPEVFIYYRLFSDPYKSLDLFKQVKPLLKEQRLININQIKYKIYNNNIEISDRIEQAIISLKLYVKRYQYFHFYQSYAGLIATLIILGAFLLYVGIGIATHGATLPIFIPALLKLSTALGSGAKVSAACGAIAGGTIVAAGGTITAMIISIHNSIFHFHSSMSKSFKLTHTLTRCH